VLKNPKIAKIAVDGASGQNLLSDQLRENGYKKRPVLPTVTEVINANAMFEQGLYEQSICHMGQESLKTVVTNCEKRLIGSKGGFGYRSINDGIDVSLLDSVILAHWLASTDKERTKQNISY
jgi:phage terminase large subunit-like protein